VVRYLTIAVFRQLGMNRYRAKLENVSNLTDASWPQTNIVAEGTVANRPISETKQIRQRVVYSREHLSAGKMLLGADRRRASLSNLRIDAQAVVSEFRYNRSQARF
jgi:hypothetical protein